MKLVAYLRVSTNGQAEEGLGLDVQEQKIRKWARDNGHRVIAWKRDEGVSGARELEHRDGLLDALALLGNGKAAGLVVYRLDRLARDLIVQEQLLAELRRVGAEVFTTSPGESGYLADDPDDPSRKLIRQVLGAVSEYERAMISLRLRSGRARKAERGGYAHGAPMFGHRAEGGELVADEGEQAVIAQARALRIEGRSLRQIADALNAEHYRTKRGGEWGPEQVRRVLTESGARARGRERRGR